MNKGENLLHLHGTNKKLLVIMCGLPGRGKTYIAKRVCRYLNWIDYKSKVINIGNYRRDICGSDRKANFFDPYNKEAVESRLKCAIAAFNACVSFFLPVSSIFEPEVCIPFLSLEPSSE